MFGFSLVSTEKLKGLYAKCAYLGDQCNKVFAENRHLDNNLDHLIKVRYDASIRYNKVKDKHIANKEKIDELKSIIESLLKE